MVSDQRSHEARSGAVSSVVCIRRFATCGFAILVVCWLSVLHFAVCAAETEAERAVQTQREEGGEKDSGSNEEPAPAPLFRKVSRTPPGRWGSILVKGPAGKQQSVTGEIVFTPGKRLQLQEPDKQESMALNPFEIRRIDVGIEAESIEKEWRWVAMGSDEKELTGRA